MQAFLKFVCLFVCFLFGGAGGGGGRVQKYSPVLLPHSHTPHHNPTPPLPTNLFLSSAHTYSHNLNLNINLTCWRLVQSTSPSTSPED